MRRYYQILGVSPDATSDEIKAAWLFSIKAFHPDKFSSSSPHHQRTADARTKAINEAYAILSDPRKRATYDREFADQGRNDAASPQPAAAPPPPTTPPAPPSPPAPASAPAPATTRADSGRDFNTGWLIIVGLLLAAVTTALILTNVHAAKSRSVVASTPPATPAPATKKAFDPDKFLDASKAETLAESKKVEPAQKSVATAFELPSPTTPSPTPRVTYRVTGLPKRTPFLNVRAGPGANYAVIAIFTPTGRGIILGPGKVRNGETVWQEIFSGSYHGWVNAEYLVAELPLR